MVPKATLVLWSQRVVSEVSIPVDDAPRYQTSKGGITHCHMGWNNLEAGVHHSQLNVL